MSRRSFLGFVVIVAVSVIGGLMVHRSSLDAAEDLRQVSEARDAQRLIRECAAALEQADAAEEAAALTGDRGYLWTSRAILQILREKVQSLGVAAADDPPLAAGLGHLRNQMERTWTAANVAAEGGRGGKGQRAPVRAATAGSQELRQTIGKLEAAQNASLSVRRDLYNADGQRTVALFVALLVAQCGGSALLLVTSARAAHARSELSFELLRTNVRLFAILGTIGEGIFQLDRDGGLVYLNHAAERILGYALGEIQGKSLFHLVHVQKSLGDSEKESALAESIRAGVSIHRAQDSFERKDGKFVAVEYTSQPLLVAGRTAGALLRTGHYRTKSHGRRASRQRGAVPHTRRKE